ncbi:MAG TPA: ferritin-like protein [Thermoanaerobaculia bacterium]
MSKTPRGIHNLGDLRDYLDAAVQLELSVIPPYMCALYTIHPETNDLCQQIFRTVIVEEMLHLINSANALNAVGGQPILTGDAVPQYPVLLPDGEKSFVVHLDPFSTAAMETFLKIEYPSRPHGPERRLAALREERAPTPLKVMRFGHDTVGAFYEEIIRGIRRVVADLGEKAVFTGDPAKQIDATYYYAGGGEPVAVYCEADAVRAIEEIIDQGEGLAHNLFDNDGDLGHYFRFDQIKRGRCYQEGDRPDHPTGAPLPVDYERVYPMLRDPRLDDFKGELKRAAEKFNATYSILLTALQNAFAGERERLIGAVGVMFDMKYQAIELLKNPIPGTSFHAGPTFQWAPAREEHVRS